MPAVTHLHTSGTWSWLFSPLSRSTSKRWHQLWYFVWVSYFSVLHVSSCNVNTFFTLTRSRIDVLVGDWHSESWSHYLHSGAWLQQADTGGGWTFHSWCTLCYTMSCQEEVCVSVCYSPCNLLCIRCKWNTFTSWQPCLCQTLWIFPK